jgi:PAS domain S-box-containing protein/putative nucleotidyltransferase with HDIG domain
MIHDDDAEGPGGLDCEPDGIDNLEEITAAFMCSPIGIYIVRNRRFAFSNQNFQEITGYSGEELAGMHPLDLVIPDDRETVRTGAIEMLKGRRRRPYRFRAVTHGGSVLRIMESVAPIHWRGKRAVLGHFMDISQVFQAETALRESEKRYRSLFELAREGIVIVRYDDGAILDANPEFLRQTEFDAESLSRRKIWEIEPPEFQDEARNSFFRFRESNGGIVSWKLCQQELDKVLPVEIIAQRLDIDDEDAILCMVRDTSEREAMMRALRLASEEWRKSFDAISDAVMLINPDFRIDRANLAAARMLSMDVRQLIGQQCHRLIHGTDAPPSYCPYLKARKRGLYCEEEQTEPHLGRTLHFSSSPLKNEEGEVTHTVEIISDVTERRRHERESLRLSRDLADSFKGITEALSDLVESRDPYTAGHSRHVADLSVMVGQEMGMDAESIGGLRVCAVLHDIGKAIIPAAILNKPGKLSPHEWGLIREHPATAFETLRHIPFPWPVAEIVHQHHERLDGSGYPRGLQGDEIHPWARILAVADVVDAMTSHRPYRPRLPRRTAIDELSAGDGQAYDAAVVSAMIRVIRLADRRIMVVENDPGFLEEMVESLRAEGHEVIGFRDPADALAAFRETPHPLLITAIELPGMDGIGLSAKARECQAATEIILTTRHGGKDEALRALRVGAGDYLEHPLDLELFHTSVSRALQRFSGKANL